MKLLSLRYQEHISCLMYRQRKLPDISDDGRPSMKLRNNSKIKFKKRISSLFEEPKGEGCESL